VNNRKYYIINRRYIKGKGFIIFIIDYIYKLNARKVNVFINLEKSRKAIKNLRRTYFKNAFLSLIILSILNIIRRVFKLIRVKLIFKDLILKIIKVSNILKEVNSKLSSKSINLFFLSIISFYIRS
jgi:hypothetical protein